MQDENLVSGMRFISNAEEWKRRVPVRWNDTDIVEREPSQMFRIMRTSLLTLMR